MNCISSNASFSRKWFSGAVNISENSWRFFAACVDLQPRESMGGRAEKHGAAIWGARVASKSARICGDFWKRAFHWESLQQQSALKFDLRRSWDKGLTTVIWNNHQNGACIPPVNKAARTQETKTMFSDLIGAMKIEIGQTDIKKASALQHSERIKGLR